ncbi:MAG: hypothetical protein Q9164_001152 [Protoblastenia rupestris]
MASRILTATHRAFHRPTTAAIHTSRTLTSTARLSDAATTSTAPITVRKPVGAFRGGIFGFLLGSVVAGAGTFYYVMEEYRVSNELLTEDIYVSDPSVELYERVAI